MSPCKVMQQQQFYSRGQYRDLYWRLHRPLLVQGYPGSLEKIIMCISSAIVAWKAPPKFWKLPPEHCQHHLFLCLSLDCLRLRTPTTHPMQ